MPSLNEFARRIKKRADKIPEAANRIKRRVALTVDQAIVLATPVDTGRARSNWLVAIDRAPVDVVDPPGSPGEAATKALDDGRAVIGRSKSEQTIHITNNLPYISKLNAGSSQQAPAMFVEEAITKGVREVSRSKVLD